MKVYITLLVLSVSGCATHSEYDLQEGTLAVNDRIEIVAAKVNNPYPECKDNIEMRRVANLSVERSERVYLQGGALCQRSR